MPASALWPCPAGCSARAPARLWRQGTRTWAVPAFSAQPCAQAAASAWSAQGGGRVGSVWALPATGQAADLGWRRPGQGRSSRPTARTGRQRRCSSRPGWPGQRSSASSATSWQPPALPTALQGPASASRAGWAAGGLLWGVQVTAGCQVSMVHRASARPQRAFSKVAGGAEHSGMGTGAAGGGIAATVRPCLGAVLTDRGRPQLLGALHPRRGCSGHPAGSPFRPGPSTGLAARPGHRWPQQLLRAHRRPLRRTTAGGAPARSGSDLAGPAIGCATALAAGRTPIIMGGRAWRDQGQARAPQAQQLASPAICGRASAQEPAAAPGGTAAGPCSAGSGQGGWPSPPAGHGPP